MVMKASIAIIKTEKTLKEKTDGISIHSTTYSQTFSMIFLFLYAVCLLTYTFPISIRFEKVYFFLCYQIKHISSYSVERVSCLSLQVYYISMSF